MGTGYKGAEKILVSLGKSADSGKHPFFPQEKKELTEKKKKKINKKMVSRRSVSLLLSHEKHMYLWEAWQQQAAIETCDTWDMTVMFYEESPRGSYEVYDSSTPRMWVQHEDIGEGLFFKGEDDVAEAIDAIREARALPRVSYTRQPKIDDGPIVTRYNKIIYARPTDQRLRGDVRDINRLDRDGIHYQDITYIPVQQRPVWLDEQDLPILVDMGVAVENDGAGLMYTKDIALTKLSQLLRAAESPMVGR
jgi:hypothetical protein